MIEKDALYPFLFEPVYKQVVWGGGNLSKVLHRNIPPDLDVPVGESWEICDRTDVSSTVLNGPLAGKTLTRLLEMYGSEIVGSSYKGGKFPLLVKIIDAGKRLSLQVHPNESACAQLGNGAEPKTEMWYIIHADRGAKIIAGLKTSTTRMQFLDTLATPEVEKSLQIFDSMPGDAYYINAGKVHAIGAGNLLLEIQQNSDTTYRISDWGRVGADGKPRQLHINEAKSCIDYNDRAVPRITGVSDTAGHNRKYPIINQCPFFRVEDLRIVELLRDSTFSGPHSSCHILTSVNQPVRIGREGEPESLRLDPGTSCLIPAGYGAYTLEGPHGESSTVIKTSLI